MSKFLDETGLQYLIRKIKEIFISDAPIDGKKYVRQSNKWVAFTETPQLKVSVSGTTVVFS